MLTLSFTPTTELFRPEYFVRNPTLASYRYIVFQESPFVKFFWRWMGNSVVVAAVTMVIVLAVASLGSFALGRIRFGEGRFVSGMTCSPTSSRPRSSRFPSSRSWPTTICSTPTGR